MLENNLLQKFFNHIVCAQVPWLPLKYTNLFVFGILIWQNHQSYCILFADVLPEFSTLSANLECYSPTMGLTREQNSRWSGEHEVDRIGNPSSCQQRVWWSGSKSALSVLDKEETERSQWFHHVPLEECNEFTPRTLSNGFHTAGTWHGVCCVPSFSSRLKNSILYFFVNCTFSWTFVEPSSLSQEFVVRGVYPNLCRYVQEEMVGQMLTCWLVMKLSNAARKQLF
jgi:hypothetical protein